MQIQGPDLGGSPSAQAAEPAGSRTSFSHRDAAAMSWSCRRCRRRKLGISPQPQPQPPNALERRQLLQTFLAVSFIMLAPRFLTAVPRPPTARIRAAPAGISGTEPPCRPAREGALSDAGARRAAGGRRRRWSTTEWVRAFRAQRKLRASMLDQPPLVGLKSVQNRGHLSGVQSPHIDKRKLGT